MSRLLVAGLALLAAGCGGAAFPEMTPPTVPSSPGTVPAAKSTPEPEKYLGKPACRTLRQRVPALPALIQETEAGEADEGVFCEFGEPPKGGASVNVTFVAWKNDPRHPVDPGQGRKRAREWFASKQDLVDDGEADVRLGEKAKWQHDDTTCYLTVLDENAVLQVRYGVFGGVKLDPLSEECRKPLRDLTESIYELIQPR